ncbi:threonine--tRNA ligase [bacterium]|nr:threonine--tRNA ligase [bacterium]
MKIKLLDNYMEFDAPLKGYEIASKISPSLSKASISMMVDGELKDMSTLISNDSEIRFITAKDKESLEILNHSTAHLMAEAIKELYPLARFGVGPAIEEGFYYDFEIPGQKLSEEIFPVIEKKMLEISKRAEIITRKEVSKKEALDLFKDDPYKTEIISEVDDNEIISIYTQGAYMDFCRGPHVPKTSYIKHFKLLSIAGAYFRGDSNRPQLERIYGVSFFSDEELNNHLNILEERKKRDHKKLGKELGLFMFSEYGPGLPFWLPKGYTLRRTLEDFWLDYHKKHDYLVVNTPIMLNKELWETSGHWDHYKDDMFIVEVEDGTYAIKPMNCPGAIQIYNNSLHSYKELPLRYAELGNVHRYEASGALNGLFRVRGFTQDDAHILLTEDQVGDEVSRIISVYDYMYSVFGLNYSIELSTRPDDFIGTIEVWDQAEKALEEACLKTGHEFKINPGDGAFYGPKLDFKLRDSMNRIWQCGTVQLDMQLPGRFNCTYIAQDGTKKTPVMIHRACFGSLERFIGIITENYAGAFPLWLSPYQVEIIPVSLDNHLEYAKEVEAKLNEAHIRTDLDGSEEKLGYKIRQAQVQKIPYSIVLGDKERDNLSVTYRKYGEQAQISMSLDDFIKMLEEDIKNLK